MITRITAKNFLSWENLDFQVNPGVTLIDGWNEDDQTSEGSGKSAILNAISWCLYGKLPKDAKIDDVIKHGESSCEVEVSFNDKFTVKRSRKPNDLMLLDPDGNVFKGKDAKETQDLIEGFAGLSFDTFCQTVYFAQNYAKKFITANQEEKGKILSEVQDLTIFDRARREVLNLLATEESNLITMKHKRELTAKDKELVIRDIKNEELRIEHVYAEYSRNIEVAQENFNKAVIAFVQEEEQLLRVKDSVKDLVFDVKEEQRLQEDNGQIIGKQSTLNNDAKNVDKLVRARETSMAQGRMLANRYQDLVKQKELNEEFIKNPSKVCPTCNTTLTDCDTSHAERELQNILNLMQTTMSQLEALSAELEAPVPSKESINAELRELGQRRAVNDVNLNELRQVKDKMTRAAATLEALERSIASKNKIREELLGELNILKSTPVEVDSSKIEGFRITLDSMDEELANLDILIHDSEIHFSQLLVLKAGFKDIKSYVFNSMLNEINARVHQYLTHLFEIPISVRFKNDDMKIETDVVVDGAERGLGLLSGGQFRRVSLAVDLALSDVITARKGAKIGVLILDEYFKDLSESSMEKCLALLEGRGQPVLLIEHNSIFKNVVTNSFMVRLEDGTSSSVT